MAQRYELSEAQWAVISPLLPQQTLGRPGRDPRQLWNGLFWVLHSGAPWRDLPTRYGPWQTVYERFRRYRRDGILAQVLRALQLQLNAAQRLDAGTWLVDATHVRAGRAAAGARKKTVVKLAKRWVAAGAG
ncbi:IS5 family transposase [Hymenobacter polaris]|uniref:IS5 family transposase n=1 Tax=Hymenobacter polaris TaxID=2682546 RepID=UPI003742E74A